MILGLGLDLCAIARMRELMANPRFVARYFDPRERAFIEGRGLGAAASLAACFAAKEALSKALGTGFSDGIVPADIAVLRRENGAPYYELSGQAQLRAEALGVRRLHLSLSHEGDMAAAVCVAEG